MKWYWIVLITIAGYQFIMSLVVNIVNDDNILVYFIMPIHGLIYVIGYPYRNEREYRRRKKYLIRIGYNRLTFFIHPNVGKWNNNQRSGSD